MYELSITLGAERPSLGGSIINTNYAITYLGVTIGSAKLQIATAGDRYDITASAQVKGMMSVLINGQGSGNARGVVSHGRAAPINFDAHVVSTAENDDIHISFQSGAVKGLRAVPPFSPVPKRVPLNADLLQGVLDPLSAALAFADRETASNPCVRHLPIFDGRRRYDVDLTFKEVENITIAPGYRDAATVCSAHLKPIAGHQVESSALKYLIESNDLEVWYIPI